MLTCVIIAKNEEKTIERAIASVGFCDEIIVVDDNSTDKTALVAAHAGATILTHVLDNDFAAQRNYALEKAEGDWILYIDADEEVSAELGKEIVETIESDRHSLEKERYRTTAYYIKRRDVLWGRTLKYGELASTYHTGIIRLVQKKSGSWVGTVHETFKPTGHVGRLSSYLNHTPHQTIAEFLNDVNFYSGIRADELYAKHQKTSAFSIMAYPFAKFIYTYFIKFGFLDGTEGFIYSFMMSFHSFLVRAKLYMMYMKRES